jgi:hypothetical protein
MQIGTEFKNFKLNNQFDKQYSVNNKTKKLIFVFSKAKGHIVKDYLDTKSDDFLQEKDTLFIADVSAMPTIIQWFVLPGLKKHKYSIVILNDDQLSKNYKTDSNKDTITIVYLKNKKITNIKYLTTKEELINNLKEK